MNKHDLFTYLFIYLFILLSRYIPHLLLLKLQYHYLILTYLLHIN